MVSGFYNINLYQGDTFTFTTLLTDEAGSVVNLFGYTGFAGIRRNYSSSGYLGIFDVAISDSVTGQVTLTMPKTGTANLPSTIALFDIEVSSGDAAFTYLKGNVYIWPQVSNYF